MGIHEAEQLIHRGYIDNAVDILHKLPPDAERDALLATVLINNGNTEEAFDLLLGRYLAEDFSALPARSRKMLLRLLVKAARLQDSELATILGGGQAGATRDARSVLKGFYCGNAVHGLSPGEKAWKDHAQLKSRLRLRRTITPDNCFIQFLKDYSSYSPLLEAPNPGHLGGGYFAVFAGYGCVIDPGHHFMENFYRSRRSIFDIDGIIVTHFHDDHFADLPALLSLIYKCNEEHGGRPVDLFLDKGTQKRFRPMISGASYVSNNSSILSSNGVPTKISLNNQVTLQALPTQHDVFGSNTGVGLAFTLHERAVQLVITGDTGWNDIVEYAYRTLIVEKTTRALIAHVSTVSRDEVKAALLPSFLPPGTKSYHSNHLCIAGLCRAIEALAPAHVVLSEIGEELEHAICPLSAIITDVYEIPCERADNEGILYLGSPDMTYVPPPK